MRKKFEIWLFFMALLLGAAPAFAGTAGPTYAPAAREKVSRGIPVRLTYGIEWAYVTIFNVTYHRNFVSVDGFRENIRNAEWLFYGNGRVDVHLGCNIGNNFNLSVHTGYGGLFDSRQIPLTLRGTYLFGKNPEKPRWISFLAAGCSFDTDNGNKGILGKAGAGYRLPLSSRIMLDFIVGLNLSYSSNLPFSDEGGPVTSERIRRNNNFATSLDIGISLAF